MGSGIPPNFVAPGKKTSQVTVWTALPQGHAGTSSRTFDTRHDTQTGDAVNMTAFVAPQLSFGETIAFRNENSARLSDFKDWVNWPQTLKDSNLTIDVYFADVGGGNLTKVDGQVDLGFLQPSYWSSMFGQTTTRVDSYNFDDYSQKKIRSFPLTDVHKFISTLYKSYTVGISQNPSPTATMLTLKNGKPIASEASTPPAVAYTAIASDTTVASVLTYHQAPANNSQFARPPTTTGARFTHSAV